MRLEELNELYYNKKKSIDPIKYCFVNAEEDKIKQK